MPVLTPEQYVQELDLQPTLELFIIEYRGIAYYTTNAYRDTPIWWDGNVYPAFPLSISGVTYSEDNNSEKPRLAMSNIGMVYSTIFSQIPDLKGATVTYIITFEDYIGIDNTTDSSLFLSKHRYTVSKLLSKNEKQIVYEMDSLLSFGTKKLPPRQMLREGLPKLRFEGLGVTKTNR